MAIPKNKTPDIAKAYYEWLDSIKKHRLFTDDRGKSVLSDLQKFIDVKVERNQVRRFDQEKGDFADVKGEFEYIFKPADAKTDGSIIRAMIEHMYLHESLQDSYLNHLKVTHDGADPLAHAKLTNRVRMLASVGGVESNKTLLENVEGIYRKYNLNTETSNALKDLRENDLKGIVVADEVFTKDGGIFSLLGDAKDQISKESKVNTIEGIKFDDILTNKDTQKLEFGDGSNNDSSLFDSVFIADIKRVPGLLSIGP